MNQSLLAPPAPTTPRRSVPFPRPNDRIPWDGSQFDKAAPGPLIGPTFVAGWPTAWPIAALIGVTLLFRYSPLDLWISGLFFDPMSRRWQWFYTPVCTWFYRGGIYPPFVLAFCGVALGLYGLLAPRRSERLLRAGTFLWVAFLIGPGIIVNCGFKDLWGRPRPHQVEQFGGRHQFVPVGTPSEQQPQNSSFPSGHAAVAFFLIAPAFIVDRRRPVLSRGLLIAGLTFGTAMSTVRVVQGGHFASDVLWSGAIVYLTCVACARLLLHPRCPPDVLPSHR